MIKFGNSIDRYIELFSVNNCPKFLLPYHESFVFQIIKPPSVMHIPEVVEESYVFGGTNAPDIGGNGGDYMNRRDVVVCQFIYYSLP